MPRPPHGHLLQERKLKIRDQADPKSRCPETGREATSPTKKRGPSRKRRPKTRKPDRRHRRDLRGGTHRPLVKRRKLVQPRSGPKPALESSKPAIGLSTSSESCSSTTSSTEENKIPSMPLYVDYKYGATTVDPKLLDERPRALLLISGRPHGQRSHLLASSQGMDSSGGRPEGSYLGEPS